MKRIGILGGTFNPLHIGHVLIAQTVFEKLGLDEVIFVPCNLPPHKSGKNVIACKDRFRMVQLAIEDFEKFRVSDYEIKQGGKSYTHTTIKYFKDVYPAQTKFYFVMGEDHLSSLHKWKKIDDLLKMVKFVVVSRPGKKTQHPDIKVRSIVMPEMNVSSTYIRQRIHSGKSIKYLVPEKVYQYIKKHNLYCSN